MSVATRATTATTIAEAFRLTAEDFGDRVAVRTKDDEVSLTWGQLRERVDALAGGLAELGVRKGDNVALMLSNRPEFHIADLAVMTLGATPFSIYGTFSPEQIAYVVGDAGARVALIESAFADAFRAADTGVEHLLVLEDGWPVVEGFDAEPHWRAVGPEDVVTLIYTSGTTGPPKGVQLVHRNLTAASKITETLIQFPEGAKVISWLPAAHIAERMAHHYLPIVFAMTVTCCDNPRDIMGYLPAVRPTWSGCELPFVGRRGVIGVLGAFSRSERAFTDEEFAFLEQVARQVAMAVENALDYEKAIRDRDKETKQRRYLEEEIRAEFGKIVGDSPALKTALELVSVVAPTNSSVLIHGRDGNRQGAHCACYSQSERSPGTCLCQIELRRDSAWTPGERAVRT